MLHQGSTCHMHPCYLNFKTIHQRKRPHASYILYTLHMAPKHNHWRIQANFAHRRKIRINWLKLVLCTVHLPNEVSCTFLLRQVHEFCSVIWLAPRTRIKAATDPGWGAIAPLKPTKVILFITILDNSENNIRDIRSCGSLLFCHNSCVKCTSSLSQ